MPRRKKNLTKKIQPDTVYNSPQITKLINSIMKDGKKTVAQTQTYKALELIAKKSKKEPLDIFTKAISNTKPAMEVRPRRVGGAAYQIPMPVRGPRRESLAIRWLVQAAQARSSSEYHTFAEKIAEELLDASKGEGGAMKKKQDMERMAEANRAFAHFRW